MYRNLAKMSTATTGTGTITLGSAETGFLSFANAGVTDGEYLKFVIEDGTEREVSYGKYTTAGTTLTRERVISSTNSGSKISLSGSATVSISLDAEDVVNISPNAPIMIIDDFLSGATESGEIGELNWNFTSGSANGIAPEANHPGIFSRVSAAGTNNCITQLHPLYSVRADQIDEMVFILKVVTAQDNVFNMVVGAIQVVSTAYSDGVYFERLAADTSWYGALEDTGGQTRSAALLADDTSWHKFRIRRISSTEWAFSIDDAAETSVSGLAAPADNTALCPAIMFWNNSGVTQRTVYLDYFHLKLRRQVR